MEPLTDQQLDIVRMFLQKNKTFLQSLGPSGKKTKMTPSKVAMVPISSSWYPRALDVLARAYGDQKYTKEEFTHLFEELGYAFTNEKGESKGSARDYLKVLHSFVDGFMRTSLTAPDGVDTSECNMIRSHINPPQSDDSYSYSLTRMVDKFEKESGNTGHTRMKQSVPFVLAAQMKRMMALVDNEVEAPSKRQRV